MSDDKQHNLIKVLEKGYIYFFYRPRVDMTKVTDLNDVERLYMVMETLPQEASAQEERSQNTKFFRLLIIGQKQMPVIHQK
jgi:hypothetical protein